MQRKPSPRRGGKDTAPMAPRRGNPKIKRVEWKKEPFRPKPSGIKKISGLM